MAGDPDALAAILDRHGPAVWRVCRAHLPSSDADDAFQATILVFLRDARRIRDARSLGGWLVRVAHLVCLKARRDAGRRRLTPLSADPPGNARDPSADAEAGDLSAAVCAELARLPSKLRAVLVLCVMEDRSNAEAARVLNIPRGTVDSRLFHAKARLKTGLTRRGIAPAAALLLSPTALPGAATAAARLCSALPRLATATPAVLTLVHGVSTTMSLVKLATAGVLAAGLIGTAGWGVIRTQARDDAPPKEQTAKPADAPPAAKPPEKPAEKPADKASNKTTRPQFDGRAADWEQAAEQDRRVRGKLASGADTSARGTVVTLPPQLTLLEFCGLMQKEYGLTVRADIAAIIRLRPDMLDNAAMGRLTGAEPQFVQAQPVPPPLAAEVPRVDSALVKRVAPQSTHTAFIKRFYDTPIVLPVTAGLSVADLLAEGMAQLPQRMTYVIRGQHVLITPQYKPLGTPNTAGDRESTVVEHQMYSEMLSGPPVSVSFDNVPLHEVLAMLRRLTGANIVVMPEKGTDFPPKSPVTGTFDDVRLFTVLEVVGDMVGLRPAVVGNVYYLTTEERAQRLQTKANREMFGDSASTTGGASTLSPPAAPVAKPEAPTPVLPPGYQAVPAKP